MRWRLLETAQNDGDAGGGGGGETGPDRAQVEAEAKKMGWSPKQYWRGNPDHWIDADEFVRRGKELVPILQSDRRKLQKDLESRDAQIAAMRAELQEMKEGVNALTQFSQDMARDRVARKKVELAAQLKTARDAGDTVREAELTQELGETVSREKQLGNMRPPSATTEHQQPPTNQGPTIQPWVKTFIDGNSDFFNDPERRNLFNAVAATMREQGDRRVGEGGGTEFLSEARDKVEEMLGGGQNLRRRAPKADEGGSPPPPSGGNRGGGKSFNDMPESARAKCINDESKFVGPNKMFKDQKAWRTYYVNEYFGPSAAGMGRGE